MDKDNDNNGNSNDNSSNDNNSGSNQRQIPSTSLEQRSTIEKDINGGNNKK